MNARSKSKRAAYHQVDKHVGPGGTPGYMHTWEFSDPKAADEKAKELRAKGISVMVQHDVDNIRLKRNSFGIIRVSQVVADLDTATVP